MLEVRKNNHSAHKIRLKDIHCKTCTNADVHTQYEHNREEHTRAYSANAVASDVKWTDPHVHVCSINSLPLQGEYSGSPLAAARYSRAYHSVQPKD